MRRSTKPTAEDGSFEVVRDARGDIRPNPDVRPGFWETHTLEEFTPAEWEATCDGCGLCCLFKISDEGRCHYTNVACRLLDHHSCQCMHYEHRKDIVTDCIVFDFERLTEIESWLPRTCAYRRLYNGQPLEPWHHLLSDTRESVHDAGISIRGKCLPEWEADIDRLEHHIIELPEP